MKRYAESDFTSANHETILAQLVELSGLLTEYPSDDAKNVRRIAKIGPKTESFCREALAQARVYQELIPRGIDLERFENALEARERLLEQYEHVAALAEKIRTAMTLLAVDIYADGLAVYSSLKLGKSPDIRFAVAKLGRCFERKPRKKEQPGAKSNATPPSVKPAPVPAAAPAPASHPVPSPQPESGPVAVETKPSNPDAAPVKKGLRGGSRKLRPISVPSREGIERRPAPRACPADPRGRELSVVPDCKSRAAG